MKILIFFSFFISSTVFTEEENQFVFESEPPVNCLEDYQEDLDNMNGYNYESLLIGISCFSFGASIFLVESAMPISSIFLTDGIKRLSQDLTPSL